MRTIHNFELYIIIAAVVGVSLILAIAAFCSCKWYLQTKSNPCVCFPFFCCCRKKRKKKNNKEVDGVTDGGAHNHVDPSDPPWAPIRITGHKDIVDGTSPDSSQADNESDPNVCMKFCMSDPVQDCCEFFDCDIMWRKKNIYTIPIFGKKKPPAMSRRPTRPAPLPPKSQGPVPVKYPQPVVYGEDYYDCEPVPEAPPSPEPVRASKDPRAMYVDPMAFLQRPFLKATPKKDDDGEQPEALYTKVKDFVLGKARKSASMASLNKLGISTSPDGGSSGGGFSKKNGKYGTGSLASLHNLSAEQLAADTSYGSKRSMSLASLHMVEEEVVNGGPGSRSMSSGNLLSGKSRGSIHNVGILPSHVQTDEYIDLEEMSKRLAAKAASQEDVAAAPTTAAMQQQGNYPRQPNGQPSQPPQQGISYTPNFIPASAFMQAPKNTVQHPSQPPPQPPMGHMMQPPHYMHHPSGHPTMPHGGGYSNPPSTIHPPGVFYPASTIPGSDPNLARYYPPVPATNQRPAVPARTAVGTPVTPGGTLGRPKPVVPPRPGGSIPNSPKLHSPKPRAPQPPGPPSAVNIHFSTTQPPRAPSPRGTLQKPTAPPPPPPNISPIESSL
ncbi:unnamed protein product [Meganyctiphanes norvegica]|uniref:Vesicular, overexpressed in cancer, prosurvival protein 1 n=1 Tax=Meganyctiphanes norvegica TaxID=48144 RepID=A0AAV2S7I5_MEGNR